MSRMLASRKAHPELLYDNVPDETPSCLLGFGALLDGFYRCNFDEPLQDFQDYYFGSKRGNAFDLMPDPGLTYDRQYAVEVRKQEEDEDVETQYTKTASFATESTKESSAGGSSSDESTIVLFVDSTTKEDSKEDSPSVTSVESQEAVPATNLDPILDPTGTPELPAVDAVKSARSEDENLTELEDESDDDESDGDGSDDASNDLYSKPELQVIDHIYRNIFGHTTLYDDEEEEPVYSTDESEQTELVSINNTKLEIKQYSSTSAYTTRKVQEILTEHRAKNDGKAIDRDSVAQFIGLEIVTEKDKPCKDESPTSTDEQRQETSEIETVDGDNIAPERAECEEEGETMIIPNQEQSEEEHETMIIPKQDFKVVADSVPTTTTKMPQLIKKVSKSRFFSRKQKSSGDSVTSHPSASAFSVDSLNTNDFDSLFKRQMDAGHSPADFEEVVSKFHLESSELVPESSDPTNQKAPADSRSGEEEKSGNALLQFVKRLKEKDSEHLGLAMKFFERREKRHLEKNAKKFQNFRFQSKKVLKKKMAGLRRAQLKRLAIMLKSFQSGLDSGIFGPSLNKKMAEF